MTDKKTTSKPPMRRINLIMWVPILTLALAAVVCFFLLDERIFSKFRENPNNWDENYWLHGLKRLGKTWVLIWLLLLWLVCAANRPQPALIGLVALLLLAPAVLPLKTLVHRPRPRDIIEASSQPQDNNAPLRGTSFPSGDTANVFAVAAALAPFIEWFWIPVFFTAAAIVALMRVTTMSHYPSDICAGAAIGIFCGWLALRITRQWLSLPPVRFKNHRIIAAVGIILMPFLISLFESSNPLLIFLKTYWPLIFAVLLIYKADSFAKWLRKTAKTQIDRFQK